MKKLKLLLTSLLMASAVGSFGTVPFAAAGDGAPAAGAVNAPAAQTVTQAPGAHTVTVTEYPVHFEAVGVLSPRTVTVLASKIMGTVTAVNKRAGDEAASGEVLVTIDETDIQADLAGLDASLAEIESNKIELEKNLGLAAAMRSSAQAHFDLASATYQRIKKLYEAKTISIQDFDKAEAEYKMASSKMNEASAQIEVIKSKKAQIEAKQKQVLANIEKVKTMRNYARVSAPHDGRITSRNAETGMLASPGAPLMTIEDYKNMQFQAIVPEQIINRVKLGDKIKVIVDVVEDQVFMGEVAEISPTGDVMTHTFAVKISLAHDPRLKSGMYARGLFEKERSKTIFIPTELIEKRGQLYMVRGVDGAPRYVRPGIVNGNLTEILSGLAPGDAITAAGRQTK